MLLGALFNQISTVIKTRNVYLDFLRGIAILLVLCRHHFILKPLYLIGWTGVDLFFVLSGYLVTSLLWKELNAEQAPNIGRFLIRRGFKIYPSFYVFLLFTLLLQLVLPGVQIQNNVEPTHILAEFFFVQNYFVPIWYHTWSLAVEEHFYLFAAFFIFILYKFKVALNPKLVLAILGLLILLCVFLRFHFYEFGKYRVQYTHFVAEGLLWGMALAYLEQFKPYFFAKIKTYRITLFVLAIVPFSIFYWFAEVPDFFNRIGLTFLYVSFNALLLLKPKENGTFEKNRITRWIAAIGFNSYSIYLWHMPILFLLELAIPTQSPLSFLLFAALSIAIGSALGKWIEQPFLKLREKYFA